MLICERALEERGAGGDKRSTRGAATAAEAKRGGRRRNGALHWWTDGRRGPAYGALRRSNALGGQRNAKISIATTGTFVGGGHASGRGG